MPSLTLSKSLGSVKKKLINIWLPHLQVPPHLLRHFAGKIRARCGIIPGHILSQDGLQEELTYAIDLIERNTIRYINGNEHEHQQYNWAHQTRYAKGNRIIDDRLPILFFTRIGAA